jgi:hypothetical protein
VFTRRAKRRPLPLAGLARVSVVSKGQRRPDCLAGRRAALQRQRINDADEASRDVEAWPACTCAEHSRVFKCVVGKADSLACSSPQMYVRRDRCTPNRGEYFRFDK